MLFREYYQGGIKDLCTVKERDISTHSVGGNILPTGHAAVTVSSPYTRLKRAHVLTRWLLASHRLCRNWQQRSESPLRSAVLSNAILTIRGWSEMFGENVLEG
jgi:hypothetical protein